MTAYLQRIGKADAYAPAFSFVWGGASEPPEELTDRCCLSALAGLSKYLPSLGAGAIIVLLFCYVKFNLTPCVLKKLIFRKIEKKTVGAVGVVDWWKVQLSGHLEGPEACATTVEHPTHAAQGAGCVLPVVTVVHASPRRYSVVYPQSEVVIHRRMAVIHIFMLTRARHSLTPNYCLPFLPSSSSKSSELMNSRNGE